MCVALSSYTQHTLPFGFLLFLLLLSLLLSPSEPGYYEDGKFGIRIESLIVVAPRETPYQFQKRQYLGFETITLVRTTHTNTRHRTRQVKE